MRIVRTTCDRASADVELRGHFAAHDGRDVVATDDVPVSLGKRTSECSGHRTLSLRVALALGHLTLPIFPSTRATVARLLSVDMPYLALVRSDR